MIVHFYRPGIHLRRVQDKDAYKGQQLKGTLNNFESARQKVIDGLVQCLERRFDDIDSGLLAATKVADLSTWPSDLNESTQGNAIHTGINNTDNRSNK